MTVKELLDKFGLECVDSVKWGDSVGINDEGVYIISTSMKPDENLGITPKPKFDEKALENWIDKCPSLTIDGDRATIENLKEKLEKFWLPKENILYIGKTTSLAKRIRQFYRHALGDTKPHAGGHWLKTLANINDLYVYFISTNDNTSEWKESNLLEYFSTEVGEIPFANLEIKRYYTKDGEINSEKKNIVNSMDWEIKPSNKVRKHK